jgi:hydroxyacid-oxoacid transhydrogenase
MSYPVAGLVRDYYPDDYRSQHPMVPHGMAVTLTAPAVFRFLAQSGPERHLFAAGLMGANISGVEPKDAGKLLASTLINLMRKTGMPNGLSAVGFRLDDVDDLVVGTMPQQRLTKLSPCQIGPDDLKQLFLEAMTYW